MKRKDLKTLALLGIASGLMLSTQVNAETPKQNSTSAEDPNDGNLGYHLMSEEELLMELTPDAIAMYKSLSPEGKKMAREVASMRCAGSNICAGLNACSGPKNSCLGKGECKGTGKCAISDKSLAVKLVHDKLAKEKMGNKRNNLQNQTQK